MPQESLCRQYYHSELEAAINKQINIELHASYVYLSLSSYFSRDDVALNNIANFFKKQSDEERGHATELMRVQNLRGGRVVFQDIQKPEKNEWGSPLEAFQSSLALEKMNNECLLKLHSVARNHNDAHMTDYIEGKYLDEQVKSINEFAHMVAALKRLGPGMGEYIFDKEHFE